MKTKNDLLDLVQVLILNSSRERFTVWVDYSGHVNQLSIRYLPAGYEYSEKNNLSEQKLSCYLEKSNEIQMMYFWILSTFPEFWFKSIK